MSEEYKLLYEEKCLEHDIIAEELKDFKETSALYEKALEEEIEMMKQDIKDKDTKYYHIEQESAAKIAKQSDEIKYLTNELKRFKEENEALKMKNKTTHKKLITQEIENENFNSQFRIKEALMMDMERKADEVVEKLVILQEESEMSQMKNEEEIERLKRQINETEDELDAIRRRGESIRIIDNNILKMQNQKKLDSMNIMVQNQSPTALVAGNGYVNLTSSKSGHNIGNLNMMKNDVSVGSKTESKKQPLSSTKRKSMNYNEFMKKSPEKSITQNFIKRMGELEQDSQRRITDNIQHDPTIFLKRKTLESKASNQLQMTEETFRKLSGVSSDEEKDLVLIHKDNIDMFKSKKSTLQRLSLTGDSNLEDKYSSISSEQSLQQIQNDPGNNQFSNLPEFIGLTTKECQNTPDRNTQLQMKNDTIDEKLHSMDFSPKSDLGTDNDNEREIQKKKFDKLCEKDRQDINKFLKGVHISNKNIINAQSQRRVSDNNKWINVSFGLRSLLKKMDDKIVGIKNNLGL